MSRVPFAKFLSRCQSLISLKPAPPDPHPSLSVLLSNKQLSCSPSQHSLTPSPPHSFAFHLPFFSNPHLLLTSHPASHPIPPFPFLSLPFPSSPSSFPSIHPASAPAPFNNRSPPRKERRPAEGSGVKWTMRRSGSGSSESERRISFSRFLLSSG
jgi:hypothetical protein